MANRNKNKGTYHEKRIVEWLQSLGLKAKRQPLSGSLGGEYRGDIKVEVAGHELVVEVKYRDASNFPSPFSVLEQRDLAIYKRRRGTPQTVVIISGDKLEELIHAIQGNPCPPTDG
jgi:Holliday junction resolvase-like predicted endonuclease